MNKNLIVEAILERSEKVAKRANVLDDEGHLVSANNAVGKQAARVLSELFIDAGLANTHTVMSYLISEMELLEPGFNEKLRKAELSGNIESFNELAKQEFLYVLEIGEDKISPNFTDLSYSRLQTHWANQDLRSKGK